MRNVLYCFREADRAIHTNAMADMIRPPITMTSTLSTPAKPLRMNHKIMPVMKNRTAARQSTNHQTGTTFFQLASSSGPVADVSPVILTPSRVARPFNPKNSRHKTAPACSEITWLFKTGSSRPRGGAVQKLPCAIRSTPWHGAGSTGET